MVQAQEDMMPMETLCPEEIHGVQQPLAGHISRAILLQDRLTGHLQDLRELKAILRKEVLKADLIWAVADRQEATVAAVEADQVVAVVEEINNVSKILNEKIHTTPCSSYSS